MYLAKMSEGSKTVVTDIGGLEWDHVEMVWCVCVWFFF